MAIWCIARSKKSQKHNISFASHYLHCRNSDRSDTYTRWPKKWGYCL